MKLLANENFPIASVRIISEAGFNILSIAESKPGITDEMVMKIAIDEKRTILTFDRDYGQLIFKERYFPPCGVIYLRWNDFLPDEPGKYLVEIFSSEEIEFLNALTVIDKNSIRQKKY